MTCNHGACTCTVADPGGFCSPACRMSLADQHEQCKCGHGECAASAGEGLTPEELRS